MKGSFRAKFDISLLLSFQKEYGMLFTQSLFYTLTPPPVSSTSYNYTTLHISFLTNFQDPQLFFFLFIYRDTSPWRETERFYTNIYRVKNSGHHTITCQTFLYLGLTTMSLPHFYVTSHCHQQPSTFSSISSATHQSFLS